MSGRVALVGAGITAFGNRRESVKELFTDAFHDAITSVDKGFAVTDVKEAFIGSLGFGGAQLGNLAALLTEQAGANRIPARRVENACASSGFAFRDAYLAVKSGEVDVALAGGVEKMNNLSSLHRRFWLGVSGDTEWERLAGATFPGVYAIMARRHMHEYGTTREDMAAVAVKNHRNGAKNPKAQFQREVTLDKCLTGPIVSSPFTVFDCCSTTDGASAAILVSEERAREFTDTPIWVDASAAASDHLAIHDRESITRLDATIDAGRRAYKQAGITAADVDVAEVHDCFTIAEILAVEDLGFAKKGEGGAFETDGRGDLKSGDVAINPSGGLKAKGHPLGATGTGQIVEIFHQLRGEAGGRQREGAEVALAHNVGGSGATCTVHVLTRRDA